MSGSPRFSLSPARLFRLGLFPLGFVLRVTNWLGVFTPVGVLPESTDSFFHLRRILAAVAHFPFVPDTDRYLNFPDGGHTYWPYGFDLFYAAFIRLCTFGMADDWWGTALASVLTPLVGAVTPLLAFTIAEELGGIRAAVVAGLLAAVLPPLVEVSMVGVIDHHVFEALFLGFYLLGMVRLMKRVADPDTGPIPLASAIVTGLPLAGGMLFTTVFPIILVLHFGVSVLNLFVLRRTPVVRARALAAGLCVWAIAVVTLAPFVASRFFEPSGVNPSLTIGWMVAAASFLVTFCALVPLGGLTALTIPLRWVVGVGAVIGLIALPRLDVDPVLGYASYGNRYVFSSDPLLGVILEAAGLWTMGWKGPFFTGTGLVLLYPVAVIWLFRDGLRGDVARLTVVAVSLALTVLAVKQLRFCNLAAGPYAVVTALAVCRIPALIRRPEHLGRMKLALAVGLICAVWPVLSVFRFWTPTVVTGDGRFIELFPTFQWIADRTPRTSPAGTDPGDYAIAARWDVGHWLVQISRRPCLGSPMTFPWHQSGIREGAAIFFAPPEQALELMRKRRARYLLVTPIPILETSRLARWNVATNTIATVTDDAERAAIRAGIYSQLLGRYGVPLGSSSPAGLRHFRLVHESSSESRFPGMDRPFAMLFEVVPGAVVTGLTQPGATVGVSGRIRTASGRRFDYADAVTADAAGRFTVVLPYATGPQKYAEVEAPEGFTLTTGSAARGVRVSEDDVRQGRTLEVGILSGAQVAR